MLTVKSILWPFDNSESSVRALETAVELAKQYGAKIYGLQAVPQVPVSGDAVPLPGFDIVKYEEQLKNSARKALKEKITTKVPEDIEVDEVVEVGKPSDVILNFAKEMKVD
ncbi:MAG: universal stress protein, partial [Desulforhopalus sp.]